MCRECRCQAEQDQEAPRATQPSFCTIILNIFHLFFQYHCFLLSFQNCLQAKCGKARARMCSGSAGSTRRVCSLIVHCVHCIVFHFHFICTFVLLCFFFPLFVARGVGSVLEGLLLFVVPRKPTSTSPLLQSSHHHHNHHQNYCDYHGLIITIIIFSLNAIPVILKNHFTVNCGVPLFQPAANADKCSPVSISS